MRNLSLVLAVCVSLWPIGSVAVSLGNMTTQSALNERFQADIALQSADVGDLESMQVSLASPRDFARAGLDRSFFLTKLKFKVIQSEQGHPVVRVTSRGVVKEPFLDFLVEINWPKGRVLKQFTALLDPREIPVVTPPVAKSVVRPKRSDSQPEQATNANATEQYVPVQKGATLRGIARSLAVDKTKTEQIVRALFHNNPHAFAGGRINGLRAGVKLKVPGSSMGLIRPKATTSNVVSNKNTDSKRTPRLASISDDTVRIVPPGSEAESSKGATETSPDKSAEVTKLRSELRSAQVTLETNRKETEGLRSEIENLKTQLNELHQGLGKKLEQMQEIPTTTSVSPPVPTPPPAPPVAVAQAKPVEPELNSSATLPKADSSAEMPNQPVSTPLASTSTPTPNPSSWFDLPAIGLPELSVPEFVLPNFELPGFEIPSIGDLGLLPDDFSLEKVTDDPVYQAVAGSLLLIIFTTFGGLWWMRRRLPVADGNQQHFEDSDIIASDSMIAHTDTVGESADKTSTLTKKSEKSEETSFLSDFSPSDVNDLQQETGEVDPAAEADVYIAYGRYQQAEILLRQMLEKFPERVDLKLKLLNVYHTTRDAAAFTSLVEEMSADGLAKSDPRNWEGVCAMGQELIPNHPLFGMVPERKTEPRRVEHGSVMQPFGGIDINESNGLDLGDNDTVLSEMPSLDAFETRGIKPKVIETIVTTPRAASKPPVELVQNEPQYPVFDIDVTSSQDSVPLVQKSVDDNDYSDLSTHNEIDVENLDFSGGDYGFNTKEYANDDISALDLQTPASSKKDDLTFSSEYYDLESDLSGSISLDELSEDISPEQSGGSNAVSIDNQLELAKFYIDIDPEMAKESLEEILVKGNPAQQATARNLLASIV